MRKVKIPDWQSPYTVIINGESFTYPAGKTVEVEDYIADTIEGAKFEPHIAPTSAPYGYGSDVVYYVNAITGSDRNSGLSTNSAFATIQKAVGSIPRNLGGFKASIYLLSDINLAENENVYLKDKHNGKISIYADKSKSPTVRGNTNAYEAGIFRISSCSADISIFGFNIKQDGCSNAVYMSENSGLVALSDLTISGAKSEGVGAKWFSGGIAAYTSVSLQITDCTIDGCVGNGLMTVASHVGFINSCTISNCDTGIYAMGALVQGPCTLSGNTTNYSVNNGGRVYTGSQTSAPNY